MTLKTVTLTAEGQAPLKSPSPPPLRRRSVSADLPTLAPGNYVLPGPPKARTVTR